MTSFVVRVAIKLVTIAFPSTTNLVSGEPLRTSRRYELRRTRQEDKKEPEPVLELDTAQIIEASKA
jgi:hypothetical protein